MLTDLQFATLWKILHLKETSNDVKVFIIIELLHSERMGKYSAYEKLRENGFMSKHWSEVDAELIPIFEEEIKRIDE